MGRMSKDKGARGERELAAILEKVFPGTEAHRGRQYHGGPDSPDVKCSIAGIHWESKRVESFSLYPSLEQAAEDAAAEDVSIVAHRRNNKPWVVCLYLEDLPKLMERINEINR